MDFCCMQELYKRIQEIHEIHEYIFMCIFDKDNIIEK